ncbi:hypothetical protein HaLaN_21348 [Haematococcus lacustris]|uniref:Uncharacterized protein n=1 Tax=Haematococcus lacustris TaxID=44745 RepID=A0A699ZYA3_HAELA|nr:hypothetical protein HaLaN_21348 [Haematococcus lacustris]
MTQPRGAPSPSPTTLQLALQGTTGRPSAAQRLAPFPADQLSSDREAEGQELGGREGPDPGLGAGQGVTQTLVTPGGDLVVALEQRLRGMAALDLVDVVVALADLHHSPGPSTSSSSFDYPCDLTGHVAIS